MDNFYRKVRIEGEVRLVLTRGHIYEYRGIFVAVYKDSSCWQSVEARTGLSFDIGAGFKTLVSYRVYLRSLLGGPLNKSIDRLVTDIINKDEAHYVNRKLIDDWEVMPL